ncbi:Hypothetical protein A7982_03785 [Minicystis rosea]|nr:Hypothetical protein A7982_03785 [Minicystis rosea]
MLAAVERFGSGPRGLLRLVVLVLVLLGSVCFQGLQVDDLWHRGLFIKDPFWAIGPKHWWQLFTFFDGKPELVQHARDLGMVPWWADDHVRLAFLRPLSCLTHVLDYALWPGLPGVMHLHSLAWYVALVLVAASLYRRVLPPAAAALAALFYAVDHNHGGVAGWIANRNAIVAATFGLAAVVFQDRASRGEARARWLGALCFGLGLLSGESALGAAGYLAAHALTLDRRPLRERLRDLAPHAAVLVTWMAAYRIFHYGASGSGMYLDPGRAPLRVLAHVPEYASLLIASEWGSIAPETEIIMPPAARIGLVAMAFVIVLAGLAVLSRSLRTRASSRFLLLGALLAILPCCATMPATRLLLLPGVGLIGLLAEIVTDFVSGEHWNRGPIRVAAGYFTYWAGLGHLVLSPLLLGPMAWQMVILQDNLMQFAQSFPPDDTALPRQRVIAVGVPDPAFSGYIPLLRHDRAWTLPRASLGLTNGTRPSEVRRIADDVVEVHAPGGFYQWGTDFLERDPEVPLPVGTRHRLSDVTIEVTHATEKGIPDVARLTFDAAATDARYRWVTWSDRKYVPFPLPAVGSSTTVPAQKPGT